MEKNVICEISELNKSNSIFSVYENVLGVAGIDSFSIGEQIRKTKYYIPSHSNKVGMMWLMAGECTIQLEDVPYNLSENHFFLIPSWKSIRFPSVSNDFKARILIADKTFMNECITNKKILSHFNCLLIKRMLQTKLERQDIRLLNANIDSLTEKIKQDTHLYYKEVVPASFMSLLLDVSYILKNKMENSVSTQSTRKEELFNKFLDLLLENYKEQHEVAFYADKLFITPQYLTLIIKELTGKTTNKWIDDTLILEARKLLKTTQTTVQQIADLLNFSDQSTFGKFFKKYHGVSPAEYRKMHFSKLSIA